jgi:hypothetical protein
MIEVELTPLELAPDIRFAVALRVHSMRARRTAAKVRGLLFSTTVSGQLMSAGGA